MRKIVIIGGGGHGKVVISILKKLGNCDIVGYTDMKDNGQVLGVPWIGTDEILPEIFEKYEVKNAVIGLGQIKSHKARKKLVEYAKQVGFDFPTIVSPDAVINADVKIGEGTVIMDGVVVNSGTVIGEFCILNTRSSIDHDCRIGNYVHIAPGVTICGSVSVSDYCLIGAGCTVIQSRNIVELCIVGAGALVIHDLRESGIYIGRPAKRL